MGAFRDLVDSQHRLASFGEHLRHWRRRRHLSQLELALQADVSTRHLSCVETGRASPSRELVLRLCERLSVPSRERNALLVAAGFAPMYRAESLDHPSMGAAHRAVQQILDHHEPWPAVAFDRHWNLLMSNRMVAPLLKDVEPRLLQPPVNVLRISLHPEGLAPHILNLTQWREHLFRRLAQQIQVSADATLVDLLQELRGYPGQLPGDARRVDGALVGVLMPFLVRTRFGLLHLISTTTVFGSPLDVTLEELGIESFFPGNDETARVLRSLAAPRREEVAT